MCPAPSREKTIDSRRYGGMSKLWEASWRSARSSTAAAYASSASEREAWVKIILLAGRTSAARGARGAVRPKKAHGRFCVQGAGVAVQVPVGAACRDRETPQITAGLQAFAPRRAPFAACFS